MTTKSLAPYEWPGNPAPRLHMTTAGMLNAVGLQGPGVEHWVDHDLPALRARGARVIASVWGRSVEEFGRAAKLLTPAREDLVAVEVNVSCPNLEDRSTMFAHSAAATAGATTRGARRRAWSCRSSSSCRPTSPISARSPAAALAAGATGLTLVNTLLGLVVDAEQRRPALGAGGGGPVGSRDQARRAAGGARRRARAHPGVPIIGTGGVTTGVDAVEMLLAGASAVGVGTATFHDPRGVAARARRARRLVRDTRRDERRRPHGRDGGSRVTDVRDRLALALDVGGPADAEAVARRLAPWFGIAKVGLELYAEAGPDVFERLRALGMAVFADLKLYDIPTTVERAARDARSARASTS